MNKIGAVLLLAALVVLAAGCGSTVRTIVKTERVEPCATPAAMEACVLALAHEELRLQNDVATVKVSCEKRGDHWSCLRFLDLGSGESSCYRITVRRVGVGIPLFVAGELSFDCPWSS